MSKDTYLIVPPYPFDKTVYFKCSNCNSGVKLSPEIQNKLNSGDSLGHPCEKCGVRFALTACPNCLEFAITNENEWNNLRDGKPFTCHECDLKSYLLIHNVKFKTQSLRKTNQLTAWSGAKEELHYMEFLTETFTYEKQISIAQKHAAVGSRLLSSRNNLSKLQSYDIKTIGLYNNPDLYDKSHSKKCDTGDIAFSVSNALISSLEVLTQEAVEVLDIEWVERHAGFPKLEKNRKFQADHPSIQEAFDNFRDGEEYTYLSGLRNCIHHRWDIPTSVDLSCTVTFPGPINRSEFDNHHRILLPDKADAAFSDITFDKEREMHATLSNILIEIEKFALSVYLLLPYSKKTTMK